MSNEDTLISKLIAETYPDSVEKDLPNNCVDLRKYFEKRLNQVDFVSISDYLEQNELSFNELKFKDDSACYRLIYNKQILDFPSNWSIFKEIKSTDIVYVDQSLDQDFLLDLFAEICGKPQNIALLKEEQVVKLVFLSEAEAREHVKWMRDYFEKKNTHQEKIAA